jgi:quinol monooxygenase YgiN
MADEPALTIVVGTFDARPGDEDALAAVLAKYVVLSRGHPGCRNIDLTASATRPGRFVVYQKWDGPADQRAHFDSPDMVEMARAAGPLLASAPELDLLQPVSAHDLR